MDGPLRARVAERIRGYAGLAPPPWLLEARLRERAQALGLAEDAYLALASGDGEAAAREREALAALLRVGETRFFRHRGHTELLRTRCLPDRARAATLGGRPVEAWSAGCASGEEAWTLAMLLAEHAPLSAIRVLGTDLSGEALELARTAVYPKDRVAEVPDALRARWFEDFGDAQRVGPTLRGCVRFARHNLLSGRYPGPFDVVLCRNVLIYFDAQTRAQVVERLYDALNDGGYLLVGYAESLRDFAHLFEAIRDDDGVVWRKRFRRRPVAAREPRDPTPVAVPLPDPGSRPLRCELRGDYADGTRLQAELKPLIAAPRAVVVLDGATFLGDEAARVLKRAAEAAPGLELHATRPAVRRWLERHGLKR